MSDSPHMTAKTLPGKGKSARKSWKEKLHADKGLPKVGPIDGRLATGRESGSMVIPAPVEVDALMRRVSRGKLTTIDALRVALARKHGVDVACPITTGIFAWIAAHAAAEAMDSGEREVTPYWRTLKGKGEINPKYPGGIDAIAQQLREEGHEVVQKGKRFYVRDYESALAPL